MVATRSHPNDFPPPVESPTKRTTRSESTATTSAPSFSPKLSSTTTSAAFQSTRPRTMASLNQTPIRRDAADWRHKVPAITIPWLALSLPLVIWDTIYIMGRPHTFAGGAIAWPMYKPYELYGRVDPVYSPEAYYSGLGWTGAQGLGNVFETLAYVAYLWIVMVHGQDKGRGEGVLGSLGVIGKKRAVEGDWAAMASLVGYTTFMITVAKSILYCKSPKSLVSGSQFLIRIVNRVQRRLYGISHLEQQHLVQFCLCFRNTQVSLDYNARTSECEANIQLSKFCMDLGPIIPLLHLRRRNFGRAHLRNGGQKESKVDIRNNEQ